ncbi:TPA: hypothetical protein ACYSXT_000881 [Streptococcus suis]
MNLISIKEFVELTINNNPDINPKELEETLRAVLEEKERFWSAGDMILGILWTQYLSSQRPNKKRVRSLGSVLTM